MLLVHFIREVLGLTGTHVGCDTSNCGACTVVLNGRAVKSCTVFAVQANGGSLLTVEEIRRAISGNLCSCTGYVKIVEAIQYAAQKLRSDPSWRSGGD